MNRRIPEVENKLIILYAINQLGSVTQQQLLTFMVENEFMNYIDLSIGLSELFDAGLLCKTDHCLGMLYSLSDLGRESLDMFLQRVPHSKIHLLEEATGCWRGRFQKEKQVLSDYAKQDDGSYLVRLQLQEHGQDLFDLHMLVPNREDAQMITEQWSDRADTVYRSVYSAFFSSEENPV